VQHGGRKKKIARKGRGDAPRKGKPVGVNDKEDRLKNASQFLKKGGDNRAWRGEKKGTEFFIVTTKS